MKKAVLILILSTFSYLNGFAQSRTIITDEGKVVTELKEKSNSKVAIPERTYHYVKANELVTTQGAFEGQLLHGMTSFYDTKGRLTSKGQFRNGLKHAKWLYWNDKGELIEIINWKKGVKNGYYRGFTDKDTFVEGRWDDNLKVGTWRTFVNGELSKVEFFEDGQLVDPKKKKSKKKRFKVKFFKEKEKDQNEKSKDSEEQPEIKDEEQKS